MAQYPAVGHVRGEHFLPSLLAVRAPAPRPEETSCPASPSKAGARGPETDAHCLSQWEGVRGEARGQPTGSVQAKPMGMHPSLIQPRNLLEQPWRLFPKLQSFLDPLHYCQI